MRPPARQLPSGRGRPLSALTAVPSGRAGAGRVGAGGSLGTTSGGAWSEAPGARPGGPLDERPVSNPVPNPAQPLGHALTLCGQVLAVVRAIFRAL